MTPALRASARYWLTGIALAAAGVCINRLLAPVFDTRLRAAVALAGELTALAGLGVIMLGIRRRIHRATDTASPQPEAAMKIPREDSTKKEHLAPT